MAMYQMKPEFEYRPAGWRIFSLFGIPVYIEAGFLMLIAFYFLINVTGAGINIPQVGLWITVVFVSILVHEMGHAITARAAGCSGIRIAFVMLGGLAYHSPTTRGKSVLICLMGPAAGFVLGAIAWVLYRFTSLPYVGNGAMDDVLFWLVLVNIFWTIFNLLPMYPLDGGQALFHGLTYRLDPSEAMMWTSRVSVIAAGAAGIWAWQSGYMFVAVLCLFIFMNNFQNTGLLRTE